MKFILKLTCILFCISTFGHATPLTIQNKNFYSQASQDKFIYTILYQFLNKQDTGHYLEIGSGHPININNTYFFEKNFGWKGTSVDILKSMESLWYDVRSNLLLIEDATKSNYGKILQTFPKEIDYLSLDVDNYYDVVLKKLPFDNHIFKIITIEHDYYRLGNTFRQRERKILSSLGYYLICPNVSNCGYKFEDWWVHPSIFPPSLFSEIKELDLKDKEHTEIIQILQTYLQQHSE